MNGEATDRAGRDRAETIALRALAWMASDEDVLAAFMAATGAHPDDLRGAADEPAMLVAVLDHLMSDDRLVVGFCDAHDLPYDAPMRARAALPGGEGVHWT